MKQIKDYSNKQSYFIPFIPDEFFKKDSLERIINDLIDNYVVEKPFLDKMNNQESGQK
jgi:hypothetical protein